MSRAITRCVARLALFAFGSYASATEPPLIVVDDRGGISALPYYDALSLRRPTDVAPTAPVEFPAGRTQPITDADMLPVRSSLLSPGVVEARRFRAPGIAALILIGDDARSQSWLRQRARRLRELGARGLVVQVESAAALDALRALAPGVPLSPVSGDDLARRLGIRHYPVLITATGIEQ